MINDIAFARSFGSSVGMAGVLLLELHYGALAALGGCVSWQVPPETTYSLAGQYMQLSGLARKQAVAVRFGRANFGCS